MATGSKNDLQKRPSSLKISDSNVAVESGDEEENHSLSCQVNNHHKDMNPMILSTFYTIFILIPIPFLLVKAINLFSFIINLHLLGL